MARRTATINKKPEKAVINELIKHIPKFDKTESFLSSPKWVEDMCKDGKIEDACSRAQQFGMDGDSYNNLWKAIEYLGIFTTEK